MLKLQGLKPLLQLLLGYLQGFGKFAQLRVLGSQTTGGKISQESAGESSGREACGEQCSKDKRGSTLTQRGHSPAASASAARPRSQSAAPHTRFGG